MKIYRTATQEDYDALMIELEERGFEWFSGRKPTSKDYWNEDKENSCIKVSGDNILNGSIEWYKLKHPSAPIVEYKAKGDKQMLNKECNQCHKKWHQDSAKYCSWCGNKLVSKPKFKVGDYVVEQSGDVISKIEEVINGDFWGPYYKKAINFFGNLGAFIRDKDIERYATPEEIEEYESALTFHKHGRKPFEVKEGDILSDSESNKFIVDYEEIENGFWVKGDFTSLDFTFLKTAEEVNEWLGADDDK